MSHTQTSSAPAQGGPSQPERRRSLRRRLLRWVLIFLLIDLATLLAVGLWALGRVPSWYRPIHLSPEEFGRVSDNLAEVNNQFARDLFGWRPITLRFTQQQLSEWLIVSDQVKRWLPDSLTDPVVVIRRDRILFAAVARTWGMEVVASISWRPIVEKDQVRLEVTGFQIGSIRFKPQTAKRLFAERVSSAPHQPKINELSVLELIDGSAMPNRFRWPNGGQFFTLQHVEQEVGRLTIRVQPLHDVPSRG